MYLVRNKFSLIYACVHHASGERWPAIRRSSLAYFDQSIYRCIYRTRTRDTSSSQSNMFVLNPGGSSSAGGSGSEWQQKLWFFGKLGLYFGAIRLAFVFMSGREQGQIESSETK